MQSPMSTYIYSTYDDGTNIPFEWIEIWNSKDYSPV